MAFLRRASENRLEMTGQRVKINARLYVPLGPVDAKRKRLGTSKHGHVGSDIDRSNAGDKLDDRSMTDIESGARKKKKKKKKRKRARNNQRFRMTQWELGHCARIHSSIIVAPFGCSSGSVG